LQGKGVALAEMGRSNDSVEALKAAVAADPSLWRAWNALAVQADRRHDWPEAEADYEQALKAPGVKPIVMNNRGYSRLLQGRYADASSDFVRALEINPGLSEARTNLRLSLAMQGRYEQATQMSGVEDRGTVLNNAGFAAVLRGDYPAAEKLFQQAVDARGNAYGRALENLKMVKALSSGGPPAKLQ
jgi:Flp pilus assembly protein TadD